MSNKNNQPGVSIIMPVHNAEKYLQQAVTGIVAQTHKHLELIIIDDHSTDNALEQLDKTDNRVCILENPGKGIVDALNHGINTSQSDFIARMDADDISLPKRIKTQVDYLLNNPDIKVCATQVEIFKDNGQLGGGYQHYQNWINQLTQPQDIAKNIFVESPIPHPTAMTRKTHWLELGGYHDPSWPEDYDLWLRAHNKVFKFGKPEGILLHWRDHDDRLSRRSSRYDKKSFFKAKAYYLCQHYKNRGFRIWGSGPTGALLHDEIISNIGFVKDFIDIAPNRIGKSKRNKPIVSAYELEKTEELILVAVSARGARDNIREHLDLSGFYEGSDYLCAA